MTPRVAFSTLACPTWSFSEIVERACAYGYDGVELRMVEGDTDLVARPEFSAARRRQRLAELKQNGVAVCGLASSVRFDEESPGAVDRQVETGRAWVELASDLEASFVRVFGDVLPRGPEDRREARLDQIASGLSRLGEIAASAGIEVLIETHGDFADTHLLARLIERVDSRGVGILWDTHHPWRFCDEPLDETLSRIAKWVRHTHWKDSVAHVERELTAEEFRADEQARTLMSGHRAADYVRFGDGEFPAEHCLALLENAGYKGWLSLEWEKAWHPNLADPEVALPPFPAAIRRLMGAC
jgi:sugar phosphate isomerase/epimerase